MAEGFGAKTLQEYLVSLGVKLDEKGMSRMDGFLKSSKMGFTALSGILIAATTVATKWAVQINKAAIELEKEAKSQKKSVEAVRASDNALKAMGKTKQEVAKDPALKNIYSDLVNMNKAMALPDGSRGLTLVKSIMVEFYRFKSMAQYALQWINYHLINKLEGPLTRIRDVVQKWREKLQTEMPLWTAKIANGIAIFVRLLETGVRAGGKIIDFIRKLPLELKVMGTAVGALWSIIRAGPLGWLLGGLTALLLLLDDFYAYKNGEKSAFAGLWESLEKGTIVDSLLELTQKGIDAFIKFMKSPKVVAALNETVSFLLGFVGQLINGAIALLMNSLPQNIQDFLGWDSSANDGTGGWKTDQRDVPVTSKGEEKVIVDGGEEPSPYPGVVYKNTNGVLHPILSKEYRDLPVDQVPQSVIDSLNYLGERLGQGEDPLFALPKYKSSATGGKTFEQTMADEFLGLLNGKGSGSALSDILSQWDYYPKLKEAFDTESGRLKNGEISQKYFDQVISAMIKGAIGDYRNATEFFSDDHQYLQWYEAYKNGTLVPIDVEIMYDQKQVSQATGAALNSAQKNADSNPVYVKVVPEYGADGDEEAYYDPAAQGGTIGNALGGRYDKPVKSTLAEDNEPEYVIPIKKLDRAIPLIQMMLAEMGSKAREALAGFGIGPDTNVNDLVASKGLGMPGGGNPVINITNNYNNTVTANPTINVYGSGDPHAIGQAAYNAQERFLVRALKGAIQVE